MIDKEKVYSYFSRYHSPVIPSTNGWYSATCPFCGKEKLAIHFDFLIAKCWRNCFKGFITDLIGQYHGINYFETRELIDSMEPGLFRMPGNIVKIKNADMLLPKGYTPILSGDTIMGERARNYLKGRGFDLNYMDRIGIGYCVEEDKDPKMNFFGYIIIPFKKRGLLSYYIGRDFINRREKERYKNPINIFTLGKSDILFNEEALYLENNVVFLTEGWSDACTIGSAGVSYQGSVLSTIQKNIILKSPIKEIILIPDADGFYKQGLEMAKDLMSYKKVKVLNLNCFYEQGLGKDVNLIGKEKILHLEKETGWVTMGFLYKELKNCQKKI